MPSYDVECSLCGYEAVQMIKLADLAAWDLAGNCPECGPVPGHFRRVIKVAPASHGGAKSTARASQSHKTSRKKLFTSSGAKDAMKHEQFKRADQDQIAAARESAAKGE